MAQSEYLKQYKKDHPEKAREWHRKYRETHKEELKAKRQLRVRRAQHARLVALFADYTMGMPPDELSDKYIVRLRPKKGE